MLSFWRERKGKERKQKSENQKTKKKTKKESSPIDGMEFPQFSKCGRLLVDCFGR
jgi:hypothetical protein